MFKINNTALQDHFLIIPSYMHFPSNQSNFSISQQTYGVNQISNFKKAVASNHKEAIQKHLSQIKLEQAELNDALMLSLANYKVEEMSNECIFLLLRHKSNPNCETNKTTPLITAIKTGQLQAVKTLIEFGAKPDQCSTIGEHPLEVAFSLKGQNFDVIECLLNNMMVSVSIFSNLQVNIEINKKPIIYLALEKQFDRVFKLIVEKGADLIFKQENILHALMKKKFKSEIKKKRMMSVLSLAAHSNKINLQVKDKNGLFPQQYETDENIRAYYQQKFKSKAKQKQVAIVKELNKAKQSGIHNNDSFVSNASGKQKETKKKILQMNSREQEVSFQEIQDDQEANIPQLSTTIDEDRQILQAGQQQQQEKRNEQYKQRNKKSKASYSLTTTQKKTPKPLTKIVNLDVNKKVKKNQNGYSSTLNSSNNSNNQLKKKVTNLVTTSTKKKTNQQKKNEDESPNNSSLMCSKKQQKKNLRDEKTQKTCQKLKSKRLTAQKGSFYQDQSPSKLRKKTNSTEQKDRKTQQIVQSNNENTVGSENLQIFQRRQRKYTQQDALQSEQRKNLRNYKQMFLKFTQQQLSQSQSYSEDEQEGKTLAQILTNQILQMVVGIKKVTQESAQSIQKIIAYFQEKIRYIVNLDNFDDEPASVQVFVYGSYANDLAVLHSDVDLLVTTSMPASNLIKKLEKYQAFNQKCISQLKFITNTTMPVIKMNYGDFKVDLTFQIRGHTGIRCSQLVRQFLGAEPLIRPLVLVLKTLLNSYGLCDTYTGGLGSYSLTLMTIALLQSKSTQYAKQQSNLGVLFLEFLLFYGFQMDYVCEAIIIHPPGFAEKPVYSIYQLPNTLDLTPKLIIYDPLNPVNNVGRATYRIIALKKLFIVWYNRLQLSQTHLEQLMDGSFKQLILDYS